MVTVMLASGAKENWPLPATVKGDASEPTSTTSVEVRLVFLTRRLRDTAGIPNPSTGNRTAAATLNTPPGAGVGVGVAVSVGSTVAVEVAVIVGPAVWVGVAVAIEVDVTVAVGIADAVAVKVADGVAVAVVV